jgi:hypothetical protein
MNKLEPAEESLFEYGKDGRNSTHEYGISEMAYTLLLQLMMKMVRTVNVMVNFYTTLKSKEGLIDRIETKRK